MEGMGLDNPHLPDAVAISTLVVNTASASMDTSHPPLIQTEWLNPQSIVYDIIYTPPKTRLMTAAAEKGCHVIGGLGMLVHQGAIAFEKWTKVVPPIKIMRQALQNALDQRWMVTVQVVWEGEKLMPNRIQGSAESLSPSQIRNISNFGWSWIMNDSKSPSTKVDIFGSTKTSITSWLILKVDEVQKPVLFGQLSLPTSEIYESHFTSFPFLSQQKSKVLSMLPFFGTLPLKNGVLNCLTVGLTLALWFAFRVKCWSVA